MPKTPLTRTYSFMFCSGSRSQGSNLSGYAVTFVVVTSALCTIIYITLGILGETFLITLVSAGIMLITIVVYFVAAANLTAILGDENESGVRIVKFTRQVAGLLLCNAVVQGVFTVLATSNDLIPLQIFISTFLMPVFLSAMVLLFLRFIRGSFARQENKITKAAIKRGTRSTASVAPATDFSSATAGGATTDV